jgi:hypothetical protein
LIIITRGSVVDFGGSPFAWRNCASHSVKRVFITNNIAITDRFPLGMSSGELKSNGGSAAPTKVSFIAPKSTTCGRVARLSITSS